MTLIFKNGSWYVQAFCIKAEGFRLFKVNRIIDIFDTGSFFYDDFSNVPPIDDEPWDMKDAVNLKLRISKDMSFRAYDEFSSENIEKYCQSCGMPMTENNNGMSVDEARNMMREFFPVLKRWKK